MLRIHSKEEILLPIPTPFLPAYLVPAPALGGPLCVLLEIPKTADNYPSEKTDQQPAKIQSWSTAPWVVFSGKHQHSYLTPRDGNAFTMLLGSAAQLSHGRLYGDTGRVRWPSLTQDPHRCPR